MLVNSIPVGITTAVQIIVSSPTFSVDATAETPLTASATTPAVPNAEVPSKPVTDIFAAPATTKGLDTASSIIEVEPFVPSKCKRDKVLPSKLNSEVAGVYDVPPYLSISDNLISSI